MKRYCLSVRKGGCVLNCSAFLDIYDNYVLISDRYNNMVSITNVEWNTFIVAVKNNSYSILPITANLKLTQTELQQIVDIAKTI
jgi:hypothetical protein